jgi:hypothetical protein
VICQRCGCCCWKYRNPIKIEGRWKTKPALRACPHLGFNGEEAFCRAYDEPWRKLTGCYTYGSEEPNDQPCPVGVLLRANGGLQAILHNSPDSEDLTWADPAEMEDLEKFPDEPR